MYSRAEGKQQDGSCIEEAQDGYQYTKDLPSEDGSRDAGRMERDQDFTKEALGSEYADFDLVILMAWVCRRSSRASQLFC